MVQKYQNEIAPIFYYGISIKSYEKDLKIPNVPVDIYFLFIELGSSAHQ